MSKHIASLISPLSGKTDLHEKNSKHFVEVMAGLSVEKDKMLVSFDATSLFNKVPIDEAVQVIRDKLQRDECWWTGLLFLLTRSRNCFRHA